MLPDEGVSCAPTELVYTRIHDFPAEAFEDQAPASENAATPDAALEGFLRRAYPKLNKSGFQKTDHEGQEARFRKERDGKTVAQVLVRKVGPRWEVQMFRACNSVAEEGSDQ